MQAVERDKCAPREKMSHWKLFERKLKCATPFMRPPGGAAGRTEASTPAVQARVYVRRRLHATVNKNASTLRRGMPRAQPCSPAQTHRPCRGYPGGATRPVPLGAP